MDRTPRVPAVAAPRWLAPALSALVMLAAAASFALFQSQADASRSVELLLARLGARVHHLDALEWQVIAAGSLTREVREELGRARREATGLLADLDRAVPDAVGTGSIEDPFRRYLVAVNDELALIEQGRVAEARELDEAEVDPAFARLTGALAATSASCEAAARRTGLVARAGSLATLLVALGAIAVLIWRVQGARQHARLAAKEQLLLREGNRRLEELNARLAEASRLKSEFLANTSHELRTPLNGMIGFLQLVLDRQCDTREEERGFLQQALQCSRHLDGLINDVLDIAKIEAGRLTLEIASVDVADLFAEAHTLTRLQAAGKGLELHFLAPEDRGLTVRGDRGKLRQVLVNLVGNGIKFTPAGSVTVRATTRPYLGHCVIEVADTGIGIAPDRQKLLFEKFAQADGSRTRRYGGAGLGLAITRSLVELMGGTIGLHSDGEGRGTRVTFTLPLWQANAAASAGDAAPGDRMAA